MPTLRNAPRAVQSPLPAASHGRGARPRLDPAQAAALLAASPARAPRRGRHSNGAASARSQSRPTRGGAICGRITAPSDCPRVPLMQEPLGRPHARAASRMRLQQSPGAAWVRRKIWHFWHREFVCPGSPAAWSQQLFAQLSAAAHRNKNARRLRLPLSGGSVALRVMRAGARAASSRVAVACEQGSLGQPAHRAVVGNAARPSTARLLCSQLKRGPRGAQLRLPSAGPTPRPRARTPPSTDPGGAAASPPSQAGAGGASVAALSDPDRQATSARRADDSAAARPTFRPQRLRLPAQPPPPRPPRVVYALFSAGPELGSASRRC